ncbi:MAG TPA: hypothetical protein VHD61_02610 [Lacunisphaera sp.]|nr:hypothetical protein [Lacunisphaera sp.]
MQNIVHALFTFAIATVSFGASFTPRAPDEGYGIGSSAWRFASHLSRDATGVIELCYAEDGNAARVLGRVDVRPFRSSTEAMPDLRILFSKVEINGTRKVVLLVSYGLRSGAFVADIPGLTTHSLVSSGTPQENSSGEVALLGFGDGPVAIKADGTMAGLRGRLFFRYISQG